MWRVLAAAIYVIYICLTTKKKSPAKNIDQGVERIKDSADKGIEFMQLINGFSHVLGLSRSRDAGLFLRLGFLGIGPF